MSHRSPVHAGLIVALCAAAAVAIGFMLSEESSFTVVRIIFTATVLLLFGLSAAAGMLVFDDSRRGRLGWLTVAVSVVGFAILAAAIWSWSEDELRMDTGLSKAGFSLLVASLALAHVSLLARSPHADRRTARVIAGTQAAAVVLATLVVIAIVESIDDDTYLRWLFAAAVLWVLGTALIPLVRGLRRSA